MAQSLPLYFSDKAEEQLEILRQQTQQPDFKHLLRLGVAVVKAMVNARMAGLRVCLVDHKDKIVKEIKLP